MDAEVFLKQPPEDIVTLKLTPHKTCVVLEQGEDCILIKITTLTRFIKELKRLEKEGTPE